MSCAAGARSALAKPKQERFYFTMTGEDPELVALIDDELDEEAKVGLLTRLAGDEGLRKRYEELRAAGFLIVAALDALIEEAPLPRLRGALHSVGIGRAGRWPFSGVGLRDFAAGFVLGLLAAGMAAWVALSAAPPDDRDDWRSAVAEYMELYTNETFVLRNPDQTIDALKLNVVAKGVGVGLTPANVALPDLRFESADLLSYDGAPLGEIAYVDAHGSPVLFCVIANGGADTSNQSEKRGDLALSSWSGGGRGYLVIGRLPEKQVAELAQTLKARF
jgi:anti-sigma factor RsiW